MRESRIPFQRMSQPLMEECDGVEMWHELEMEVVKTEEEGKERIQYRGEEKNKDYIVVGVHCWFVSYYTLPLPPVF